MLLLRRLCDMLIESALRFMVRKNPLFLKKETSGADSVSAATETVVVVLNGNQVRPHWLQRILR